MANCKNAELYLVQATAIVSQGHMPCTKINVYNRKENAEHPAQITQPSRNNECPECYP